MAASAFAFLVLAVVIVILTLLLDHLDPEGDAAQVLIPFVVVAQVRAFYPALHLQLLVVVLLLQQQLDGHQRLQVVALHRGEETSVGEEPLAAGA